MLRNVTIAIKTFERLASLDALLTSISRLNLACPIIIADDSEIKYAAEIQRRHGDIITKYISLPYNSGLSKGRNALVGNVETDYFLLCEDDFIFDGRTNLTFMAKQMQSDLDILGGICFNRELLIENKENALIKHLARLKVRTARRILLWSLYQRPSLRRTLPIFRKENVWDFYGNFRIVGDVCYIRKLPDADYAPPFTKCDFVPNFFMAKTQSLRDNNVYWDNDIKYYGEHLDFFFRVKRRGLKVAITKEAGVIHQRIHNPFYNPGHGDRHIMMQKNNLRAIRETADLDAAAA